MTLWSSMRFRNGYQQCKAPHSYRLFLSSALQPFEDWPALAPCSCLHLRLSFCFPSWSGSIPWIQVQVIMSSLSSPAYWALWPAIAPSLFALISSNWYAIYEVSSSSSSPSPTPSATSPGSHHFNYQTPHRFASWACLALAAIDMFYILSSRVQVQGRVTFWCFRIAWSLSQWIKINLTFDKQQWEEQSSHGSKENSNERVSNQAVFIRYLNQLLRRDQSFDLKVLFNLGSFGHTGLHHLAGHVLLGAQGRPVRPGDRVLDAAPRASQLDGHVLGLAAVGPGVEQQLVGSGVDHDVPHFQFVLGDLLAVVAHQVARVDPGLGEEPGIPDNAHASLHVASVVGIGIVGDVGIDPLHGPADGFGPVDASQS